MKRPLVLGKLCLGLYCTPPYITQQHTDAVTSPSQATLATHYNTPLILRHSNTPFVLFVPRLGNLGFLFILVLLNHMLLFNYLM